MFACDACNMEFKTQAQVIYHQAAFCIGQTVKEPQEIDEVTSEVQTEMTSNVQTEVTSRDGDAKTPPQAVERTVTKRGPDSKTTSKSAKTATAEILKTEPNSKTTSKSTKTATTEILKTEPDSKTTPKSAKTATAEILKTEPESKTKPKSAKTVTTEILKTEPDSKTTPKSVKGNGHVRKTDIKPIIKLVDKNVQTVLEPPIALGERDATGDGTVRAKNAKESDVKQVNITV